MLSPKFPLKVKDLKSVVNVSRLKSTWKNKVRDAMRTQPVPDPIEHLDFHIRLDAACTAIEAEVLAGGYIPRPPIRFLAEKSKGLCRQLVIPSAKDALVLQTLSDALWVEIKTKAPSSNAFYAPDDHKFSTFKGHSSEYGPLAAWLSFQQAILGFTKKYKYIVVTDIANYYDFISYDHLRNVLSDLTSSREHSLDLLIYALSYMLWQPDYMPRVPIGLPQCNLDAPRLLAHSFLFEIDRLLGSKKTISFARYMDDIDIGVDSVPEAKELLRDLDLSLQTRQVRLNSGKTQILSEEEAIRHFKIRENVLVDKLVSRIETKLAASIPIISEKAAIRLAIKLGLKIGSFKEGNGGKILKRLITLARQQNCEVTPDNFVEIMYYFPALRSAALSWWQNSNTPAATLKLLRVLLERKLAVDDAFVVELSTALVAARLPKTPAVEEELDKILQLLTADGAWQFYARAWILSKYRSSADIMRAVETKASLWVTQEHLSRLVAGLLARMVGSSDQLRFESTLRRSGNGWSQSVLDFVRSLTNGIIGYSAAGKFIQAGNPSFPNRISHAKFLMVRCVLSNPAILPAVKLRLKTLHGVALTDEYYKTITP